ncbi:MAG: RICIN domain-containing protein [Terracidiphilus sp.]
MGLGLSRLGTEIEKDQSNEKSHHLNTSTKAWNVTSNGTASGSLIQTWTYAGASNEEWEAVSLGSGYYKFVGQGSGLCLDVPSASTANGVPSQIYTCNDTAAQAFKLVTP